ncbi:MAG: dihydropteroate synthase [Clostridiales bacterium]|nr:dihydropteroate synthase [Clostridiales bacterium]
MGILNVTPDSFSDGGMFNNVKKAISHAEEMLVYGADIIDIGGESTRPGSSKVNLEEELLRTIPIIKEISKNLDTLISIDSYKSKVAYDALKNGAHIINDVWGFQKDNDMARVAAEFQVPSILMHNKIDTNYDIDIIESMKFYFDKSIELGLKNGLKKENIILDPGIGFGKTPEQNVYVMNRLDEIKDFGFPILLGVSRKSMIGKILDLPVEERLEGTLGTNAFGILAGCEIIRVHDVKENYRMAKVMDSIIRGTI